MRRTSLCAGTCVLILTLGLTGISFPENRPGEKAGRTMQPTGRVEAAQKQKGDSRQFDKAVIARVNGTDIIMRELIVEMNQIAPAIIKDSAQMTPENIAKLKETAFGILIFRELAIQEAVRQGMKPGRKEVEEAKAKLKKDLGSEENYRNYLRQMDLTEKSLLRQINRDILFTRITQKEIFQKVPANDRVAIEKRKSEWENKLKKKARIEVLLAEVEKKMGTGQGQK